MRGRHPALAVLTTLALSLATAAANADGKTDACEAASLRAQRARLTHSLIESRKQALACALPECPPVIRRDCDRWVAELDGILPTVVLGAQNADGHDLHDVRVEIDGAVVTEHLDGSAQVLDPGAHLFRFTPRDGSPPLEQSIIVREGERNRPVAVTFPPIGPPKPSPSVARDASAARVATGATLAFAGASVLAFTATAIFGIGGVSRYRDLKDGCGRAHACLPADVEDARTRIAVADVAFGIGVVAAAAALTVWLTRPRAPAAASGAALVIPTMRF